MLKITLDYWNFFVPDIFSSAAVIDANAAFAFAGPVQMANRRALYSGILSKLRQLCITRMAKPEEARQCLSLRRCQCPQTSLLYKSLPPDRGEHGQGLLQQHCAFARPQPTADNR